MFVILGNTYDIKTGQWRTDSNYLLNAQELWFAVFMTILYASSPSFGPSLMFFSILLPWVTLREVPVEVEIVSPPFSILRIELINVAVAQSSCPTIQPRDAARSPGQNRSHLDHGIPRLWDHQRGPQIAISLHDLRRSRRFYEVYSHKST